MSRLDPSVRSIDHAKLRRDSQWSSFGYCFFFGGSIRDFLGLATWLPLDPAGCSILKLVVLRLAKRVLAERIGCPWTLQAFLFGLSFLRVALSPHVFRLFFVSFRSWFLLAFQEVVCLAIVVVPEPRRFSALDSLESCDLASACGSSSLLGRLLTL